MVSFDVLRHRDFKRLWLGQAVSQFGDAMYFLVFLFMADRISGSNEKVVALVGALSALPFLFFSNIAGHWADRIDRRLVMLAADWVSFALLLSLAAYIAAFGTVPIWVLYVMAFSLSAVQVFFLPAKSATVPRLVPGADLQSAIALSMATQTLMPLIGVGISGTVLAGIERAFPNEFFFTSVLINALTFGFSALCVRGLPPVRPQQGEEHATMGAWESIRQGIQVVKDSPVILSALVVSLILNITISPFMVVHVLVNKRWFGGHYWTLASFEASFVGVALLTSLRIHARPVRAVGWSYILGVGLIGVGVCLMAVAPYYWPYLALNAACGIAFPYSQIPIQAYIQATVPDQFRGRVSSLFQVVGMGLQPLSTVLAGLLFPVVGPHWMFVFMGGGMVLAAVYGLSVPALRRATMPDPA